MSDKLQFVVDWVENSIWDCDKLKFVGHQEEEL